MKDDGERKTGNDRTRKYQVREIFSFRDIMSFKAKGLNAKKTTKKRLLMIMMTRRENAIGGLFMPRFPWMWPTFQSHSRHTAVGRGCKCLHVLPWDLVLASQDSEAPHHTPHQRRGRAARVD